MDFDDDVPSRLPCDFCNRQFNPDSLLKHSKVCEKTLHKKRKVFDSAKQRIKGTELAEFLPVITHSKKRDRVTSVSKSHSRWKENHMALIKIIKEARNDSFSNDCDVVDNKRIRITSVTRPFNQQKCIYCDRSFGPKSFDRHIEWCKEKSSRIDQRSPAVNQEAKERLEARVKYRAPIFRSRRSITREKYAPKTKGREDFPHVTTHQKINEVTEKAVKEAVNQVSSQIKQPEKTELKKNNFIRQNVLRCSYKSRLPNKNTSEKEISSKTSAICGSRSNISYVPYKDQIFSDGSISATGTKIKPSQSKLKMNDGMKENKNKIPNIDNRNLEYNPYLSAELQMQELMKENNLFNSSDEDLLNGTFTISSPNLTPPIVTEKYNKMKDKENFSTYESKPNGMVKSISSQTSIDRMKESPTIGMSPTSAFSRYSSNVKLPDMEQRADTTYSFAPMMCTSKNEFDHFLPPVYNMSRSEVFEYPSDGDNQFARYPLVSLSNLSLCSSVSIDIQDDGSKKGVSKSAGTRHELNDFNLAPIQRSISLNTAERQNKDYSKNKHDPKMVDLLYGSGKMEKSTTSDNRVNRYETEPHDDDLNRSICYENMERSFLQSVSDLEKALQFSNLEHDNNQLSVSPGSSSHSSDGYKNMSLENKHDLTYDTLNGGHCMDMVTSKMSIDSAYNRSPVFGKLHTEGTKISLDSGINSSKSSTPFVPNTPEIEIHDKLKVSKYCHECGAKYPVAIAKFCCECGVRSITEYLSDCRQK